MLTVNLQASLEKVGASKESQLLYLLAKLTPPPDFSKQQTPLNVALVIDRSTSMKGERLDHAKRAATKIIEKLSGDDILSIVTYSDRAEVVLQASRILNHAAISGRIRGIVASGGTEIFQGIRAAIKEMHKADLESSLNHLILLTDGHTYGDEDDCLRLAENAGKNNIGISAFGIGSEWNDDFLDKLVAPSGGQSGYIESPEQIVEFLQKRIQTLGAVYATNVVVEADGETDIQFRRGLKLKPYTQPISCDNEELKLGDVEVLEPLMCILEIGLPPLNAGTNFNITLNFSAGIPSHSNPNQSIGSTIRIPVIAGKSIVTTNKTVVEATRFLNFYQMNEKAWKDAEAGDVDLATLRLRRLTTRLLESGFSQLATQAHFETERLERLGNLSEEGKKRLKFSTRSLLSQAFIIPNES